ncbi:ATP-grasp domain-containing protein [Treponema sp. C6A8]|uniref:ATP-grasp domain-containing protein n=1 Tax=Treponema sp. C6A8 TaxID=1410609 RepID=UPI00056E14D3|nr:ATP-grasp domain-containing protein [Treponema sp. C6A8]
MKNILILGAGLMQKPAILSARELGYKTYVIDADPKAVAVPLADEFCKIDLKAREEILAYAEKLKNTVGLSAVFTAGTDFSASVSYVCEKLGLASHSFEAAQNASIKTRMRECFSKASVPSPDFFNINSDSKKDLQLFDDGISYKEKKLLFPLVVKPVDNMGARGCRMIRSKGEFESSLSAAIKASRSGNAILEEYMEGEEYSIDALVYNGTFTVTGFAVRHIKYPPYFIEVGHTMPAVLSNEVHDELISIFACGAKALGLTCGAAKADIKFTKNGAMIGEIAGRLSGGYMSGWTYPYASDLNLTKEALLIAAGEEPADILSRRKTVDFNAGKTKLTKPYELFEIPCTRTSAERAWISIPGKVQYIEEIKEYTDQAVRDILPRATVSLGGSVDFPRNNVEKCGNVIAVSHSRDIAISASEDAASNVFITLEPDNAETENFLNGTCLPDEEGFPPSAFAKLSEDELAEITGQIPEKQSVKSLIPAFLLEKYGALIDWNYNTISQTAEKFDILRKKHPAIEARKFWSALMRGGLQAAVYVSDSQK